MKVSIPHTESFPLFERRVKQSSISFYSHSVQDQKLPRIFTMCPNVLDTVLSSCLHLLLTFISRWENSWEDLRCVLRREGRSQHNSELEYVCLQWPRDLSGWFPSHLPPGAVLCSFMCWDPLNRLFFFFFFFPLVGGAGCNMLMKS